MDAPQRPLARKFSPPMVQAIEDVIAQNLDDEQARRVLVAIDPAETDRALHAVHTWRQLAGRVTTAATMKAKDQNG